jgi:hypothetical protein
LNETLVKFLSLAVSVIVIMAVLWNIGFGTMMKTETGKLSGKMDREKVTAFQ